MNAPNGTFDSSSGFLFNTDLNQSSEFNYIDPLHHRYNALTGEWIMISPQRDITAEGAETGFEVWPKVH